MFGAVATTVCDSPVVATRGEHTMARMNLFIGRANTGKTQRIFAQMQERGKCRKQILLVPEHISHQTEVDLVRQCGAGVSRYAEVLSPRLLANRVLTVTGGLTDGTLDAGGKLLMMQLALQETASVLKVYARPSRRASFLAELVTLCDELQSCRVLPETLGDVSQILEGMSGDKLRDVSLIYAAYLSKLQGEQGDRRDLMTKLLERLEESGYADGKDVYLDGFSYFTAQEEQLIAMLLHRCESVSITLLGEQDSTLEIFHQSLRTRDRLLRLCSRDSVPCHVVYRERKQPTNALQHLEANFFGGNSTWQGDCSAVRLYRASGMFSEVEYVASEILRLVREKDCRFRDIAVVARNIDDYAATMENVFERYGIPFYLSRRSDILEKPVISLLTGVLDSVAGGYEYEDMFHWLKTGLAGLNDEECDILENYVILWDIHGSMWVREEDWRANPDGWCDGFSEEQEEKLAYINTLRARVSDPLRRLAQGYKAEEGATGKLKVLWQFLEDIGLAAQLSERTEQLEQLGELQRASEYSQLWELLCSVMDQFAQTLGDMPMDHEEFGRLMKLILTQYDIGTIPASLDQVQVSQITRNERRQSRYVFLIGCNDHVLPAVQMHTGLLNREDRSLLSERGIELAPSGLDLLDIELQNLYATIAQPYEGLCVTWPTADLLGNPLRPSFVVGRIRALLESVEIQSEDSKHTYRLRAGIPALEMAGGHCGSPLWDYFATNDQYAPKLTAMQRAAGMTRGRLSEQAVEALYGRNYRLSASKIDKINSCHFAYFMQYGLRAKERNNAKFDATQIGTFMHYVLEQVTRKVMACGGFSALEEGELQTYIDEVIHAYIETSLPGFTEKEARFQYLFRRLGKTVTTIVENAAEELQKSDFVPLYFELDFSEHGTVPAISMRTEEAALTVVGKVDRVDGWLKDGKLYLRVVDYKSGKKAFDLSDVRHGLNIQMLLYLFALQKQGKHLFQGQEVVPAGILYFPARDVLIHAPRGVAEQKLRDAMDKELRRSGMVLAEPAVLEAMEHGALENPRFLPLSIGKDGSITKGVATAEELGKLSRYVDTLLKRIATELHGGNIDADPCGHNENDNACTYCEFASACHFMDMDENDHMKLIRPIRTEDFWNYIDESNQKESEKA